MVKRAQKTNTFLSQHCSDRIFLCLDGYCSDELTTIIRSSNNDNNTRHHHRHYPRGGDSHDDNDDCRT